MDENKADGKVRGTRISHVHTSFISSKTAAENGCFQRCKAGDSSSEQRLQENISEASECL